MEPKYRITVETTNDEGEFVKRDTYVGALPATPLLAQQIQDAERAIQRYSASEAAKSKG